MRYLFLPALAWPCLPLPHFRFTVPNATIRDVSLYIVSVYVPVDSLKLSIIEGYQDSNVKNDRALTPDSQSWWRDRDIEFGQYSRFEATWHFSRHQSVWLSNVTWPIALDHISTTGNQSCLALKAVSNGMDHGMFCFHNIAICLVMTASAAVNVLNLLVFLVHSRIFEPVTVLSRLLPINAWYDLAAG